MKKLLIAITLSFVAMCSMGALAAGGIGVVDMATIFAKAPQAKAINKSLKQQFSARKQKIIQMGKSLQTNVKSYQKNQSVMDKKKVMELQQKINQQSVSLRKAQAQFQSDLLAAQNKKMKDFIDTVKTDVKKVAQKKGLEIVLPTNAVLYSEGNLDITDDVLAKLKG